MPYTIMIIMPQSEIIECIDVYAETDAEAMEYAMNQARLFKARAAPESAPAMPCEDFVKRRVCESFSSDKAYNYQL